jgi:hypothetical protein
MLATTCATGRAALALTLVVGPDDLDGPVVVAADRDRLGDGVRQLALGALDVTF